VILVDLKSLPSDELVQMCLKGPVFSDEAWLEFTRRFSPAISLAVSSRLGEWTSANREDVEELVQQVYFHLCENEFSRLIRLLTIPPRAIVPYLRAVAINLTTDYLRKRSAVSAGGGKTQLSLDGLEISTPENVEQKIFLLEVHRHLERCAASDLKRARTVFWLYYRVGLTANEIANLNIFKLEVKGVESLLHRLTDCVRRIIAEGYSRQNPSSKKENVVGKRSQ
jgi:RNA polymerase sigma-70 factor, ECF subfamily